jgi:4-oxalocrotonate tautomerase
MNWGNESGDRMPHVEITLLKGRTLEQKRKVAARVTDVLAEEAGAKREDTTVAFLEVDRESFAHGGVLVADRK